MRVAMARTVVFSRAHVQDSNAMVSKEGQDQGEANGLASPKDALDNKL